MEANDREFNLYVRGNTSHPVDHLRAGHDFKHDGQIVQPFLRVSSETKAKEGISVPTTDSQTDTALERTVQEAMAPMAQQVGLMDVDMSMEDLMVVYMRVQNIVKAAREVQTEMKQAFCQWLDANGDIIVGDIRYYHGATKTTKCTDKGAALEAILEAGGGDLEKVLEMMTSQPFKHGACKTLLGDRYESLFETTVKDDVKTGKPKKGLQTINERMLKKG